MTLGSRHCKKRHTSCDPYVMWPLKIAKYTNKCETTVRRSEAPFFALLVYFRCLCPPISAHTASFRLVFEFFTSFLDVFWCCFAEKRALISHSPIAGWDLHSPQAGWIFTQKNRTDPQMALGEITRDWPVKLSIIQRPNQKGCSLCDLFVRVTGR